MKKIQKKWKILSSDFVLKGIFKWIVICEKKTDQSDHALEAGWKKPKFLTRISFCNWNISGRFKPFFDFLVFSDEKQYSSDNNGPENTWYNNSNKLFHVNFNAMELHAHHCQTFRVIAAPHENFPQRKFKKWKKLFAASLNLIVLENRCVIV